MAQSHKLGTRIGNGRETGLGHQSHVAFVEKAAKSLDLLPGTVFIENVQVQGLDLSPQTGGRQKAPGGA